MFLVLQPSNDENLTSSINHRSGHFRENFLYDFATMQSQFTSNITQIKHNHFLVLLFLSSVTQ